MEEENYRKECINFISEINVIKNFDYSGFKTLLHKFSNLGSKNSNYAATEELGKIESYLALSHQAKNPNKKFEYWDEAKTLLIENVEIWIGI